jgi:hypothetical protein
MAVAIGIAKCSLSFEDADDNGSGEVVLPLEQVVILVMAFDSTRE